MKNTKTKSGSTKKLKLTSLEHENNDIEPIKLNSLNSRNSWTKKDESKTRFTILKHELIT